MCIAVGKNTAHPVAMSFQNKLHAIPGGLTTYLFSPSSRAAVYVVP